MHHLQHNRAHTLSAVCTFTKVTKIKKLIYYTYRYVLLFFKMSRTIAVSSLGPGIFTYRLTYLVFLVPLLLHKHKSVKFNSIFFSIMLMHHLQHNRAHTLSAACTFIKIMKIKKLIHYTYHYVLLFFEMPRPMAVSNLGPGMFTYELTYFVFLLVEYSIDLTDHVSFLYTAKVFNLRPTRYNFALKRVFKRLNESLG